MNNRITIGLPSKGRLKDKAISFFEVNGFKILQSDKERNYFASVENRSNIKIIFLFQNYFYNSRTTFSNNCSSWLTYNFW